MIDEETWLTRKVDWWGKSIYKESWITRKVDWWGMMLNNCSLKLNSITEGLLDGRTMLTLELLCNWKQTELFSRPENILIDRWYCRILPGCIFQISTKLCIAYWNGYPMHIKYSSLIYLESQCRRGFAIINDSFTWIIELDWEGFHADYSIFVAFIE